MFGLPYLEIVYSLRYCIYEFWRQYTTVDINFSIYQSGLKLCYAE